MTEKTAAKIIAASGLLGFISSALLTPAETDPVDLSAFGIVSILAFAGAAGYLLWYRSR